MLISQEANDYIAGQVLIKRDINGTPVGFRDSNGASLGVTITQVALESGSTLSTAGTIVPANKQFIPSNLIWQLVAKSAASASVIISETISGVSTILETLSVSANVPASGSYERVYGATYSWSSTNSDVLVEVL